MGTLTKPYTYSPNTSISSSEMNANLDTIYNEFNGSIEEANFTDDGVTGTKIAPSNVTTAKIPDDAATSAKFASNTVSAVNIDWASTGAGAGIWWEELGRTTLTTASDTMSVTIPVRKYLQILVTGVPSGVIDLGFYVNGDTGANYARRQSTNGGADNTGVSITSLPIGPDTVAAVKYSIIYCVNVAAQEKLFIGSYASGSASGAGTAPARREQAFKWTNTTNAITSITITNSGSGDMATGSSVIVLGHN